MYKWTGNVGLINVSDVLKASMNTTCKSATDVYNVSTEVCGSYLTYFDTINEEYGGIGYWTINAFSAESGDESYNAWYVGHEPGVADLTYGYTDADYTVGARPVVFLKSSIQFTEGNGSKSNPYIVQ